jgi:uncharacterized protein YecE (DUF72 family)
MTKGDIRIGTSGWVYAHWTGKFYPNNRLDKLDSYSKLFDTVEVNMTFYRLPREPLIAAWDKKTPSDFKFSFKVSRLITHHKRLKNAEPYFERFLEALGPVRKRGKLGCILFQFPPDFTIKEKDKLAHFCKQLPDNFEYAVEFRHPSWLKKDTWSLLTRHYIAYAISDSSIRAFG